ncbi:G-protein coupled receptor 35-like [Pleurodeles waltl]|uniref:G-protein coupled receptor 35-like n=1 Tax=Pleurodeles waltl TaxID=8319 RepID=UPI003709A6E6
MNCTNLTMEPSVKVFQLIIFIPTLSFGLVFNGLALWVFCFRLKKWTETRVYMINLIISDFSLLFTFPFRLYSYNETWSLGKRMCDTVMFIYFLNVYMSILIITMIAVDRYIAIQHPLKAKVLRSPVKAAIICTLLWIIIISFRTYLLVQDAQWIPAHDNLRCFQKNPDRPMKRILFFSVFGFFLPFLILTFCSIQVIRILKRKITKSQDCGRSVRKAIQIVVANLFVFVFCFLPDHVGKLIRFGLESSLTSCTIIQRTHTYIHITTCLSHLNCCLDAICYYFVAKEFWEASGLAFTLKCLQKARNQTEEKDPKQESNPTQDIRL